MKMIMFDFRESERRFFENNEFKDFISDNIGMFVKVTDSLVRRDAQTKGNAAFLAPLI